jgi:hypothetical protein
MKPPRPRKLWTRPSRPSRTLTAPTAVTPKLRIFERIVVRVDELQTEKAPIYSQIRSLARPAPPRVPTDPKTAKDPVLRALVPTSYKYAEPGTTFEPG